MRSKDQPSMMIGCCSTTQDLDVMEQCVVSTTVIGNRGIERDENRSVPSRATFVLPGNINKTTELRKVSGGQKKRRLQKRNKVRVCREWDDPVFGWS